MRSDVKDISGQRFGRLVAVSIASRRPVKWVCRCDCGNVTRAIGANLRAGRVRSCGCIVREGRGNHRTNRTGTYVSWERMIARCCNPNCPEYKHYGARGVVVIPRWNDFAKFLLDMGERPEGMSLDRIDPYGNYTPDNCRWATTKQQARNKRNTIRLTINGETMSLAGWAERAGVKYCTAWKRHRNGLSPSDILKK